VTPTQYKTVFELGLHSFPWSGIVIPGFLVMLGFGLYKISREQRGQLIGSLLVIFGILSLGLVSLSDVSTFVELRRAYVNGISSVVEGPIESFHPMPSLGPASESFTVRGVNFSYNVLDSTPCFHNAPAHLGPIRQGQFVRVHYEYDNGCIQRMEIRADGIPTTAERSEYAKAQKADLNLFLKTDSRVYRMNLAASFVALIMSLCCNLDWRHYVRYWVRHDRPYSRNWELSIRSIFFLALVIIAADVFRLVNEPSRTIADFEKAGILSLPGIGLFLLFDQFVRWRFRVRKQRVADAPQSAPTK
jgi:hypothetical protein